MKGLAVNALSWRHGLVLLATAMVFAIDLQTPWGVATWILYAFPMFLLCRLSGDRHLVRYAALVSVLIVTDHFLSQPQAPLWMSVSNRVAGLAALWSAVWLIARRERERRALLQLRQDLEATVAERTAALRQAEEHCRQGEARMRSILERSSDVILECDASLRLGYASPSITHSLGYRPDEVLGAPALDFVHPEDAPKALTGLQRLFGDPASVVPFELRVRHKDGDFRWFEALGGRPDDDPAGRIVVVNVRDIGERVRARAELRRREEEFRVLFEHAPFGIASAGPDGRYTLVNPAMCRLFGYTAEEMLRLSIAEVTHPDDVNANEDLRQSLYRGEIPHFSMEKRYLRKDGTNVWGRVTVAAVRDSAGAILFTFGTTEDITAQREAERRRTEALQRQRDVLVREVHHRIKNNLQGVIGLLQQFARGHDALEEPMHAAMARVAAIAALHGLHAAGSDDKVKLCELVDAVAQYDAALFPVPGLTVERLPGWQEVQFSDQDAVAVALVVNELVLNAIKACTRGDQAQPVRIALARDGDEVSVSITNACGRLPPEFDFAAARGLGTGLTLARSLLPQAGARLSFRQIEPQGVEARLVLSPPVVGDI